MYRDAWNNCQASVCSINFFNAAAQKISSGTGFKVDDFLVTNNHVYAITGASTVELHFVNADGHSIRATKTISYIDFQGRLQRGETADNWDYAILSLNDSEFTAIPSLTLANSNTTAVGQKIAVLGYQFEQNHLSIKQGILSSRFLRVGVKYMQLDSSVNAGNSGGPLINVDTNRVVGIVTRKHTGLSKVFEELIQSFDTNIVVMQRSVGQMSLSGYDPVRASVAVQHQLKQTAIEIQRSANVGIGFAYELDLIKDFFDTRS